MKRVLAPLLVALVLVLPACGSSERSGGEGAGRPGNPAATSSMAPSPLLNTATLEERNRQLNDIIEFDRDVQVALAVYLNRNIAPEDRAFLCAVLHTKAAKTYFKCSP